MYLAPRKRSFPGPFCPAVTSSATSNVTATTASNRSITPSSSVVVVPPIPASTSTTDATRVQTAFSGNNQSSDRTTRLRPYPCRICGVILSSSSNRVRHERSKHADQSVPVPFPRDSQAPTFMGSNHPNVIDTRFEADGIDVAFNCLDQVMDEGGADQRSQQESESGGVRVDLSISDAESEDNQEQQEGRQHQKVRILDAAAHRQAWINGTDENNDVAEQTLVKVGVSQVEHGEATFLQSLSPTTTTTRENSVSSDLRSSTESDASADDVHGILVPATSDMAVPMLVALSLSAAVCPPVDASMPMPENSPQSKLVSHSSPDITLLERIPSANPFSSFVLSPATIENTTSNSTGRLKSSASFRSSLNPPERITATVPDVLDEEILQRVCYPFLQWLTQPPITSVESLVKARRVACLTQLQPIKLNLRFLFGLLVQRRAIDTVDLFSLTQLTVCRSLQEALTERSVGSARLHAVFLLVKKVLVFWSSQESTRLRQFIQPTACESYFFVESVCSDNSQQRKQEARNRAVLGFQTSRQLREAQPVGSRRQQGFQVPLSWSTEAGIHTKNADTAIQEPSERQLLQRQQVDPLLCLSSSSSSSSSRSRPVAEVQDSNALSSEDLTTIAKGCLQMLADRVQLQVAAPGTIGRITDRCFVNFLVCATLCLGLAPRSQVLKQLRIGSTFVKEGDGRYWIKMPAELNKNGRPTLFALAGQLTPAFDLYLDTIRPRLLRQQQQQQQQQQEHSVELQHNYVFFKKNGSAPRSDFSEPTAVATQHLIGRPVNAHAFRSAVITSFYSTGASQAEMDTLASIMAHDPSTARNYYFKPQASQAALGASQRMLQALGVLNFPAAERSTRRG